MYSDGILPNACVDEDAHFTLAHVPVTGEWAAAGACRGVDSRIFFPVSGDTTDMAIAMCKRCPVLKDCRDYAVSYPKLRGVWGGMSEQDRKVYRARELREAG